MLWLSPLPALGIPISFGAAQERYPPFEGLRAYFSSLLCLLRLFAAISFSLPSVTTVDCGCFGYPLCRPWVYRYLSERRRSATLHLRDCEHTFLLFCAFCAFLRQSLYPYHP